MESICLTRFIYLIKLKTTMIFPKTVRVTTLAIPDLVVFLLLCRNIFRYQRVRGCNNYRYSGMWLLFWLRRQKLMVSTSAQLQKKKSLQLNLKTFFRQTVPSVLHTVRCV